MADLGDRVKDTISGFTGIVTARTTWLQGCDRVAVSPQELDKDGKPFEHQWFDEPQVEVLTHRVIQMARIGTGGPRPDPSGRRAGE